MIRAQIEQALNKALAQAGAEGCAFTVERPASFEHGDYATNAALVAARVLKKSPKEVAEELCGMLRNTLGDVEKIEVAGAGFINFFLTREAIAKEVATAAAEVPWGGSDVHKGERVMVEYTDPNPFKEFHIGHLMSNAIGESIARLLECSGARVVRANYQGDVGPHVAKALWGKMHKPDASWGEAYVYGSEQYEANKAEIDEINKKVYEKSDPGLNKLYDAGRAESLAHFDEIYKTLGTKFDKYFFESEATPLGVALVGEHPEVFEESDGARVFRGETEGLHTRVFLTSQGLPTYEAKDLGLLELKSKEKLDASITVTANEQTEYFKVVLAAARHLPELKEIAGKTTHMAHGMMRFAEGKMASRKGNVITGESLLVDLKNAAKEKMQEREVAGADKIAEQVAVGAVKYAVLKQGSNKDIIFDPEKSLSLEGDSGPYLQYALVRTRALLQKAKAEGLLAEGKAWPSGLERPPSAVLPLERLLVHFPDVLLRAVKELEPHFVTTYLTELAGAFNSWYAAERIIGGDNQTYGLLLVGAVEKTLAKGLTVLGIPTPEKM